MKNTIWPVGHQPQMSWHKGSSSSDPWPFQNLSPCNKIPLQSGYCERQGRDEQAVGPKRQINPATPTSDQCQISPAASPEIYTIHSMENVTFHSLLRWKIIILPILANSFLHFLFKGWENVLFELRSEKVKARRSRYSTGSHILYTHRNRNPS